jgi:predicted transcriptional regulator
MNNVYGIGGKVNMRTEVFTMRISPELLGDVRALAQEQQRTVSSIGEIALSKMVAAYKARRIQRKPGEVDGYPDDLAA